jgi:uncharacterized phage protein gp47/JayE
MTNTIDETGLHIDTSATIASNLVAGFQNIYGTDINIASNSPDGQLVGILTQTVIDLLEFIASVNAGFNPDTATGSILEQRVTINNIARIGGSYTVQPVDITCTRTVTLEGLDGLYSSPTATAYTVQDNSGNQFYLAETATITAGTHTLNFRAAKIGEVNVSVGTLTVPVTIVNGVTAVTNSLAAITVGQNQETDAQLRTRRQQSVALSSNGYLNGLLGTVKALPGVTEAVVFENITGDIDINGTPAHCVWLVVLGGSAADIANALYGKISAGCNMRGNQHYTITNPFGQHFIARWDNPTPVPLYIDFTIKTTLAGFIFSMSSVKKYIVDNLKYEIGAYTDTSEITATAIAAIAAQGGGGGGVPINMQISTDGSTWVSYLDAPSPASQWNLSVANISIEVDA